MKLIKLLSLIVFAVMLTQCGTTQPVESTVSGRRVLEVMETLVLAQNTFYDIAVSNLNLSPGQVMVMTYDSLKNNPNIKNVALIDSSYMDIELNSGLRTAFIIGVAGADGLSATRGGINTNETQTTLESTIKSKNTIQNKKILIFAPFVGKDLGDLYSEGDLPKFVDFIKSTGNDFEVKLLENGDCSTLAIESFGEYGLVIIDTHGAPDAFFTGHVIQGLDSEFEVDDAAIKKRIDYMLGVGGYEKLINGNYRFAGAFNLASKIDWRKYLERISKYNSVYYRIVVTSKFINGLSPMPNTIVLGNMCYSGWSNVGNYHIGTIKIDEPIKTAFMNKQLISYYSYGYNDGTSAILDNSFAKKMEDSLVRALIIDGDSTRIAHLNANGKEFSGKQLGDQLNPDMLLRHFGADDYSYVLCGQLFRDDRDGEEYKTVCIGKQFWMAENLRHNAPGSVFYDNNPANGPIYGKLYDGNTVMNGASSSTSNPSGVQGICPKGWHLPSNTEWEQLVSFIKNKGGDLKDTKLWDSPNTGATNLYGFNALGGGNWYIAKGDTSANGTPKYAFLNRIGYWFSTQISNNQHNTYWLSSDSDKIQSEFILPTNKMSCRCLKD